MSLGLNFLPLVCNAIQFVLLGNVWNNRNPWNWNNSVTLFSCFFPHFVYEPRIPPESKKLVGGPSGHSFCLIWKILIPVESWGYFQYEKPSFNTIPWKTKIHWFIKVGYLKWRKISGRGVGSDRPPAPSRGPDGSGSGRSTSVHSLGESSSTQQ